MIKLKIFSLIIVSLGLSIFIYGFFISLAKKKAYGKLSIGYFFLTPTDLTQMEKLCKNSPELYTFQLTPLSQQLRALLVPWTKPKHYVIY